MNSNPQSTYSRFFVQIVAASTEYVLIALWLTAALFGALVAHGPHAHERFYSLLLWAMVEMRTFLLWGAVLFIAMWCLHRAGLPLSAIRILGAVSAPVLAVLIARPSFYALLNQPGYYFLGPIFFVADLCLCALVYGVWLLPRHFKPNAVPRLHVHLAVFALFVPFVPSLILHAANPGLPGPIFGVAWTPPVHRGRVIFARWTPGSEPLAVEPFVTYSPPPRGGLIPEPDRGPSDLNLSEEEIGWLRSGGVTGEIKMLGGESLREGGRLVLILSQQIDAPFQFLVPAEGVNVIYLQGPDGWRKMPPNAGESKSLVRVYVPDGKPNITGFEWDSGTSLVWHEEQYYRWSP